MNQAGQFKSWFCPFLWASPFPSLDLSLLSYKMGIIIQQVSKLQEDSDYICFLHCVLLVFRVGDWDTVCVWETFVEGMHG